MYIISIFMAEEWEKPKFSICSPKRLDINSVKTSVGVIQLISLYSYFSFFIYLFFISIVIFLSVFGFIFNLKDQFCLYFHILRFYYCFRFYIYFSDLYLVFSVISSFLFICMSIFHLPIILKTETTCVMTWTKYSNSSWLANQS